MLDFPKLERQIFSEIHKLNVCVCVWRSFNSSFKKNACAQQQYLPFFNLVRELIVTFLIVRSYVITDDQSSDFTIGKWIKAMQITPEQKRSLRKKYNSLLSTEAHRNLVVLRRKFYAHSDEDAETIIKGMKKNTYNDLFGIVDALKEIYNEGHSTLAGKKTGTEWDIFGIPHTKKIKDFMGEMFMDIEKAHHREDLHKRLLNADEQKDLLDR